MKITAIAALCTAPLALAGTLDMDLRSRGLLDERNGLILGSETSQVSEKSNGNKKSNSQQGGNSNGNNNNGITSITTTSSTEIILIWVNEGNGAATSTVNSAAAATAAAAAATHTIVVGGTEKVFTPPSIAANVGDMVLFQFAEQNHTATTSAFDTPCTANGAFDTGFMPNINGTVNPPPQVMTMVNVSTPVWFYCRQKTPASHCGLGMTFSINPTANKTQAEFAAAAIAQDGAGSTAGIVSPPAATSVAAAPPAASSVAVAPPAASASSSSGTAGLTSGQGTTDANGACTCAVVCAAGSIPNPASQGINAIGGMGSVIPAANLAT